MNVKYSVKVALVTTLVCMMMLKGWKEERKINEGIIPHSWMTSYNWEITGKERNRERKAENGNGKADKQSVRILHWNLGEQILAN